MTQSEILHRERDIARAECAQLSQLTKDFLIPRSTRNVTILSPQTLATKINEGRDINGGLYNSMDWFAKNEKLANLNLTRPSFERVIYECKGFRPV